jgi:hypothetical protein
MTLPPEKVGDKGQRFQIKYSAHIDAMDDERYLGYAATRNGAEEMAAAWRQHPEGYFVWVVDRDASVINEAAGDAPVTPRRGLLSRRVDGG